MNDNPVDGAVADEPALELPKWVPETVGNNALMLHRHALAEGGPTESLQLLCRLATDPRIGAGVE